VAQGNKQKQFAAF